MGWNLAGFKLRQRQDAARAGGLRAAPRLGASPPPRALPPASASRASTRRRLRGCARMRRARLYLFDVRDPDEYAAGHVTGALSAPGGQLVQATDQYAGTLGARIVVVDDAEVRAVMTASWLRQMGWREVFVLVAKRERRRHPRARCVGPSAAGANCAIDCSRADSMTGAQRRDRRRPFTQPRISEGAYSRRLVRDPLAARRRHSREFRCAQRSCSPPKMASSPGLRLRRRVRWTPLPIRWLDGGNAAWRAAGHAAHGGRCAHGGRADRCLAQALRAPRTTPARRWRSISRGKTICCPASRATAQQISLVNRSPPGVTSVRPAKKLQKTREVELPSSLTGYLRQNARSGKSCRIQDRRPDSARRAGRRGSERAAGTLELGDAAALVVALGLLFYGINNSHENGQRTANPAAVGAFPAPAAGVSPPAPQTTTGLSAACPGKLRDHGPGRAFGTPFALNSG